MSEQLTGRALDKAIAEALGWRVEPVNEAGYDANWVQVFDPSGDRCGYLNDHGNWVERIHVDRLDLVIPSPSADANATLAVCAERGWYLSFTGNTALIAYPIGGDFARTHRGDGTTPQEAGARALLAALTATADR